MLLQFTVENVLSFREEAVLSLLAVPGVEHAPGQVIDVPALGRSVLRVVALYGANASGKSNLVKAMALARGLILDGTRPGKSIAVVPFKLYRDARSRPCRFELELWADGRRWSYGFACTTTRVEAEWLYRDAGDGERNVFNRALGSDDQLEIEIGDALTLDEERRRFWGFVAEGTRDNQLFLAEARERNVGELATLLRMVQEDLIVVAAGEEERGLVELLDQRTALSAFASELLRESGTGVHKIDIARPVTMGGEGLSLRRQSLGKWVVERSAERRLVFLHQGAEDEVLLEEAEESDGTRRLVGLSPPLFSLLGSRTMVVVDELDRSLHSLLSRNLLERFLATDPATSGQLIFTTHDTNLLDLELLPHDSIWFVEKDLGGGSSLYSLAEFKPEQLEQLGNRIESGYLHGRFGGTPFLSNPRSSGSTGVGKP